MSKDGDAAFNKKLVELRLKKLQEQQKQQQQPYDSSWDGAIACIGAVGTCTSGNGNDWWFTNGQRRRQAQIPSIS